MSGPLPDVFRPVTVPLSGLYGAAITMRNAIYDAGHGVRRVDRPVISVGNITAGGTGKTPFVRWLTRGLLARGVRPVIAMRGYRARGEEPGDEQREYAVVLPDVHVIAQPDRVGGLRAYLPEHAEVDCVLLDDGFQHRRLHRDLDLVLIDATRDTMHDRLLPAGWLREPLGSLRRTDAVIVTRAAERDERLAREIERHHGRPPVAWTRHVWGELQVIDGSGERHAPTSWLDERRVVTMLGVGHPQSVRRQLTEAGAVIVDDIAVADHQHYSKTMLQRSIERIRGSEAEVMVTTGKDWVKIRDLLDLHQWPVPVVVPDLTIEFLTGADALLDLVLTAVRPTHAPQPAHPSVP